MFKNLFRPITTEELDRSQERVNIGIIIAVPVFLVVLYFFG